MSVGVCNSKSKPKKGERGGEGGGGVVQIKDFCSKSIKPAN